LAAGKFEIAPPTSSDFEQPDRRRLCETGAIRWPATTRPARHLRRGRLSAGESSFRLADVPTPVSPATVVGDGLHRSFARRTPSTRSADGRFRCRGSVLEDQNGNAPSPSSRSDEAEVRTEHGLWIALSRLSVRWRRVRHGRFWLKLFLGPARPSRARYRSSLAREVLVEQPACWKPPGALRRCRSSIAALRDRPVGDEDLFGAAASRLAYAGRAESGASRGATVSPRRRPERGAGHRGCLLKSVRRTNLRECTKRAAMGPLGDLAARSRVVVECRREQIPRASSTRVEQPRGCV